MYPNLSDQTQFRLNKINGVKIRKREAMSKGLDKYVAYFDYFDKELIVLSAKSDSIFTASFASVIGAHVGITSASFSVAFSIIAAIIVKKLLTTTQNKNKKHNKIVMLARNK